MLLQKSMVSSTVLYLVRTKNIKWDFPGGPVVKNPSASAGDTGSIPGQGTKIPPAIDQLSLHTTRETPTSHWRSQVLELRLNAAK